ncbi:hypothetical protein Tco_0367350 [Tanacetum coccineum]
MSLSPSSRTRQYRRTPWIAATKAAVASKEHKLNTQLERAINRKRRVTRLGCKSNNLPRQDADNLDFMLSAYSHRVASYAIQGTDAHNCRNKIGHYLTHFEFYKFIALNPWRDRHISCKLRCQKNESGCGLKLCISCNTEQQPINWCQKIVFPLILDRSKSNVQQVLLLHFRNKDASAIEINGLFSVTPITYVPGFVHRAYSIMLRIQEPHNIYDQVCGHFHDIATKRFIDLANKDADITNEHRNFRSESLNDNLAVDSSQIMTTLHRLSKEHEKKVKDQGYGSTLRARVAATVEEKKLELLFCYSFVGRNTYESTFGSMSFALSNQKRKE